MSDLVEGCMNTNSPKGLQQPFQPNYTDALRLFRKQLSSEEASFSSQLFPVSWSYALEQEPEPVAQVEVSEEKAAESITEKTKVLDSLHEFASKQLEGGKESFKFPGGEGRRKATSSGQFGSIDAEPMSANELKGLSSAFGQKFADLKFSLLKDDSKDDSKDGSDGVKILFVAAESSDTAGLEEASIPLEAFFETPAAILFDKMIAAMKLSPGDAFVSSLKIVGGPGQNPGASSDFLDSLSNEIFNLKPQIVVPLGGVATKAFLGEGLSLQNSHGQFFERKVQAKDEAHDFEVMPLFSPAFLVEAPNSKRIAWEDMQKAMKKLGL